MSVSFALVSLLLVSLCPVAKLVGPHHSAKKQKGKKYNAVIRFMIEKLKVVTVQILFSVSKPWLCCQAGRPLSCYTDLATTWGRR